MNRACGFDLFLLLLLFFLPLCYNSRTELVLKLYFSQCLAANLFIQFSSMCILLSCSLSLSPSLFFRLSCYSFICHCFLFIRPSLRTILETRQCVALCVAAAVYRMCMYGWGQVRQIEKPKGKLRILKVSWEICNEFLCHAQHNRRTLILSISVSVCASTFVCSQCNFGIHLCSAFNRYL